MVFGDVMNGVEGACINGNGCWVDAGESRCDEVVGVFGVVVVSFGWFWICFSVSQERGR